MSKIMELADEWKDALCDYHCEDASNYRAALQAEVERMEACLKRANDNHEHFEREWYLRGDQIERMEAAHQQEIAQVKADLKSCQAKNREQLAEIAALREELEYAKGEGFLTRLGNVTKPLIAERDALREALTVCVCAMQDYQAGIGITEMFDKGERLGRLALMDSARGIK